MGIEWADGAEMLGTGPDADQGLISGHPVDHGFMVMVACRSCAVCSCDAADRVVSRGDRISQKESAGDGADRRSSTACLSMHIVFRRRHASQTKAVPMVQATSKYHANHLYSVAALTSAAGGVVERYAYGAYGQRVVLNADGSLKEGVAVQDYGFTGRELDGETGLWYFRARYFDDSLGRFFGRDPLGYVDGYSMYRGYFVPRGMDPSGTWTCAVHKDDAVEWAIGVGGPDDSVESIGDANVAVDSSFSGDTWHPVWSDQSYRFNRNQGGEDSRLMHFREGVQSAKDLCTDPVDDAAGSLPALGKGLHALQDWWAHGDWGVGARNIWTPHAGRSSLPTVYDWRSSRHYHDNIGYDAKDSSDGRPTANHMRSDRVWALVTPHPMNRGRKERKTVTYVLFEPGNKRYEGTRKDTVYAIRDVRDWVKDNATIRVSV